MAHHFANSGAELAEGAVVFFGHLHHGPRIGPIPITDAGEDSQGGEGIWAGEPLKRWMAAEPRGRMDEVAVGSIIANDGEASGAPE